MYVCAVFYFYLIFSVQTKTMMKTIREIKIMSYVRISDNTQTLKNLPVISCDKDHLCW